MAPRNLAAVAPVHATEDAPASAPASDPAPKGERIGRVTHGDAVTVVSVALAAARCSQQRAADLLGMSDRVLRLKLDPQGDRPLSLTHAARLAQEVPGVAPALASWIASLAPAAKPVASRAPEAHAMRLSAAVGDVAEHIDEAMEDGSLTREERREIARDLQRLIDRAQAALLDLGDL
jgi:hypothetical protein